MFFFFDGFLKNAFRSFGRRVLVVFFFNPRSRHFQVLFFLCVLFMFFFVKSTAGFDYEDAYKKRESLAVSTHLSFPPPHPF